jgi:hypothetical protein
MDTFSSDATGLPFMVLLFRSAPMLGLVWLANG